MPRGRLTFRECDIARAMRAAAKVGAAFHIRIERTTGDILVLPGEGPSVHAAIPVPEDDLDAELKAWAEQHGQD